MIPLLVGSILAVLALAFVVLPIMHGGADVSGAVVRRDGAFSGADETSSAIEALREVEFDRATGKLSDDDYAVLRATYAPLALAELSARETGAPRSTGSMDDLAEDPAERLIARVRARRTDCATCGPRPEADALFCSSCGHYLPATCLRCEASVIEPDARFCVGCGTALAAPQS